jgi:hypothetical protein
MSSFEFYRTDERGIIKRVENKDALKEIGDAQMSSGRGVEAMTYSNGNGNATIAYADGRVIRIRRVRKTRGTVVTVSGKSYTVSNVRVKGNRGSWSILDNYVSYWNLKNGQPFGPTRTAGFFSKPGTVGAQIWAEVSKLIG